MYREVTQSIQITVEPLYRPDSSKPDSGQWFWAYTVEIANLGDISVTLLSRKWHVTDANGFTEIYQGPGVAGAQPDIPGGATYTYTSGCPLSTPSGIMVGEYTLLNAHGEVFVAKMPNNQRVLN